MYRLEMYTYIHIYMDFPALMLLFLYMYIQELTKMLCNKDSKNKNKTNKNKNKKKQQKTDLKGTEIKFQCLFTRYSLVLRHFACQTLVDF